MAYGCYSPVFKRECEFRRDGLTWPEVTASGHGRRQAYTTGAGSLSEVPRLHCDRVEVQIRNVDIARPEPPRRKVSLIRPEAAAVPYLIAASVRQRKPAVALADAGEVGGQIREMIRNEVDDGSLALDLAAHRHHAR
jgi:hypothetical protein